MRKQVSYLFIFRAVRLIVALINVSLAAKYFGITLQRDVWLLALNCILIFDLLVWGPVNDTFRAKFLFLKTESGEIDALNKAKSLIGFSAGISLLIVIIILLFSRTFAKAIAPGYTAEEIETLAVMIRIIAPVFLLNQINKLFNSILNAYSSFIIPEVAGLVSQLSTTFLIMLFAARIGILSLAISYYFGMLLLMVLCCMQFSKLKLNLFSNWSQVVFWDFKPFLWYAFPLFIPYAASQFSQLVEKSLASLSIGSVAMLDYGRKFSDIPLEVMVSIIISMMVPILSAHFAANKKQQFLQEFKSMYQLGFFLLLLVTGMLISCPEAFVKILYQHGNVSLIALKEIAQLTTLYACSAVPVFLYQIYGASLLAARQAVYYGYCGIAAQVLMIILNLVFYQKFGIYTFPCSLFLSHLICAIALFIRFPYKNELTEVTLKYLALLVTLNILLFTTSYYLIRINNPYVNAGSHLFLLGLLTITAIFLFKFEERKLVVHMFKRLMSS